MWLLAKWWVVDDKIVASLSVERLQSIDSKIFKKSW